MFQALATFITFSAQQTMPANPPLHVRLKRTDSPRQRRPSLKCMWHADRATGRLASRWTALQLSETLAFDVG